MNRVVYVRPDTWPIDIDEMAALYDSELNILLDKPIPLRRVSRRQRTSDPYFDKEYQDAKHVTRRLKRAYAATSRSVAKVSVHSTAVFVDVAAAAEIA